MIRLGIRKKISIMRVAKLWNRFPRGVAFLERFKVSLDEVWNNLM